MRSVVPFDTHAYIKKLVTAGMPEAQAEVQAEAMLEMLTSHLATKEDLRDLEQHMETRFAALEQGMTARFAQVELRLEAKLQSELRKQMIWFFGMLVVLAGALVGLLRFLPLPA